MTDKLYDGHKYTYLSLAIVSISDTLAMLSLIWLVFKGVLACAFTIVVYVARVRTKSPKCIIRFICRPRQTR